MKKKEELNQKELLLNKEIEKISVKQKNILPKKEIDITFKGIKKINKLVMEHINIYQILKQDKNIVDSINNNDEENNKINKLNLVNDVILDNYLNTINIGYIGYNNENNDELSNDDIMNNINNECEPVPSFLLCLQKAKE